MMCLCKNVYRAIHWSGNPWKSIWKWKWCGNGAHLENLCGLNIGSVVVVLLFFLRLRFIVARPPDLVVAWP